MCSAFNHWALESHVDCDLNIFTMYPVGIWALVPSGYLGSCPQCDTPGSTRRDYLWLMPIVLQVLVIILMFMRKGFLVLGHEGLGPVEGFRWFQSWCWIPQLLFIAIATFLHIIICPHLITSIVFCSALSSSSWLCKMCSILRCSCLSGSF